jgi:hypothetical protein
MDEKYCQCCAMPMGNPDDYGTEKDGSKSADYCKYCYDNGAFTFHGTMDEMIDFSVPYMVQNAAMSEDAARAMLRGLFPTLKRWRAQ